MSHWIFLNLSVLKGKIEGGKTGLSPIVTAVRSHLGCYLLKGMGAVKKAIAILENENVGMCDRP
ncbi:hypothetical protein [Cylindrospermopsis raciborskii]|uniref:hypothetical protein n=1 Tax=Cylindrospermopsis raciborskii TaxID=77022 RepID=UPI00128F197B|nr:hypothetical protein [Cylindrospermopsis raciborskii]